MSTRTNPFANLGFQDFRKLAKDKSLSKYEKIGFPDSYRAGKEEIIYQDIIDKLPSLNENQRTVLDIGPGCSDLPVMLINLCLEKKHSLILIDSAEMLANLPDFTWIEESCGSLPELSGNTFEVNRQGRCHPLL